MNEALAGFWWFEDLSLLMDRGGHVLWAIGLLGTVTGMIESFETLSAAGGSDPGGLTGGISAALLTTLAGLVTALPGVFAVHRLERRTDRLADKVRARLRRFMRPSCCRS